MTPGFVALAFSFCAGMSLDGGQDTVSIGYVSEGECIVRMEVGDSNGGAVTVNGHAIGIEMIEGGAVVGIDELRFVIVKTEGV